QPEFAALIPRRLGAIVGPGANPANVSHPEHPFLADDHRSPGGDIDGVMVVPMVGFAVSWSEPGQQNPGAGLIVFTKKFDPHLAIAVGNLLPGDILDTADKSTGNHL